LFIGILSSLPVVGSLNVCCCLWVVVGGVAAVYLRQQQLPTAIEPSEAVLVGLIAGVIGAVIDLMGTWLVLHFTGPLIQDTARSQIESNPDIPPAVRDFIMRMMSGQGIALMKLAITLPCYAVFSILGGLLGMAIFKKKTPPPVMPT
jgi:hypothetical protein